MNTIINEELNKMKYLLGYQRGKVVSEQAVSQVVQGGLDALKPQNTAPASSVEDVVKQIQTILNTKYGTKLAVDGKWGNLTQTAFETAVKSKTAAPKAAPTTPASGTTPAAPTTPASGTTLPTVTVTGDKAPEPAIAAAPKQPLPSVMAPTVPGVSYQTKPEASVTEPAAENPENIVGTEVAQPTRRDQRRERQDLRRSNRRAMQDLRTQQRAQ